MQEWDGVNTPQNFHLRNITTQEAKYFNDRDNFSILKALE